MLPKFQLSIHDVRPSNQKRVRSPNKANVGIYQTPKALEKRMKAEGAIRKIPCDLDDSVMELNSYGAMNQTFSEQEMESPVSNLAQVKVSLEETSLTNEIVSRATANCDPSTDVGKITLELVKVLVPAVVQSIQTAVEKSIRDGMENMSRISVQNTQELEGKVNSAALLSKYERDDIEQQGRKESLRMFGVRCPDGETNENLIKTVVQKISNVNIDIDEKDISVCHRQGAKVDGKQPILVKFISRNKRNEVLNKKKELRINGCSVQEDLTALRAKLLKMMINSDFVDSVRVSNGKLYAYKKHGVKFEKIGCVTNPGDLLAIGFQDIDYEYLGLVKYLFATSADIVSPDDNFH